MEAERRKLMQYFMSKGTPRTILIMFDRDDLLLEGLQEVVKKERIDTAAITGGIGSLQRVHLHTITTTAVPSVDKYWNFTGAIELASVQGSIIGGDAHAHITIFDWDSKATYIGHLEPGSVVAYRAEVSLTILEGVKTERYMDEQGHYRIRQR
jgi:predicted DNA-binding protein with PD1-like motif